MNIPDHFIKRPYREGVEIISVLLRRPIKGQELSSSLNEVRLVDTVAKTSEIVMIFDDFHEFAWVSPKIIGDLNVTLSNYAQKTTETP